MMTTHRPVHPGEVLLEEFLTPLGISQHILARAIGVPPTHISAMVNGTRGVTADMGLRLSRALSTSDRFWLNLQTRYDLEVTLEAHASELADINPLRGTTWRGRP